MARITNPSEEKRFEDLSAGKKKRALVLAGGGITGVTYEIGALQALDRFFGGGFSVTEFDIVIGLSAGALVGSLLANGVTPAEMFAALDERNHSVEGLDLLDIFYPNFSELVARPLSFPSRLVRNGLQDLVNRREFDPYRYLESLEELLPSGIFSNERIETYLRKRLTEDGRSNEFGKLETELYIAATDLDSGERAIFGDDGLRHIPISRAVQASTALPIFYKPVRINGKDYIDGAIQKSLHIDIALKHGADLIICINPLVPLYNEHSKNTIPLLGGSGQHLSQKGLIFIAHQVMRILVHSRISSGYEMVRHLNPAVDILLIEPRADDERMFFYNLMKYSARLSIACHGYQETLESLSKNFRRYQRQLLKHGLRISQHGIRSELERIRDLPPDSYHEFRRFFHPRARDSKAVDQLRLALDTLERELAEFST